MSSCTRNCVHTSHDGKRRSTASHPTYVANPAAPHRPIQSRTHVDTHKRTAIATHIHSHTHKVSPTGKPSPSLVGRRHTTHTFVEPQVCPPLHRNKVAEPLVRQLVRHHICHVLARARRRLAGLPQQVHGPVRHQAPMQPSAHARERETETEGERGKGGAHAHTGTHRQRCVHKPGRRKRVSQ
jgi:hypothetical protein